MSSNPIQAPAPDLDGDRETIDVIENPPQSISGILARLGPGLIIAASIVGSGELIATTKTGASAGFTLLWLILIGCVIKVFAQIEIGRFTMTKVARRSMPSIKSPARAYASVGSAGIGW